MKINKIVNMAANKKIVMCLVGFFFSVLAQAQMSVNVFYGEDNRHEPYEVSGFFQELSRSVAGRVATSLVTPTGAGFKLDNVPLGKRYCSHIRFAEQIMGPTCSGFLVAPNLLVTAAHCMNDELDCSDYYWIFGYGLKSAGDRSYTSFNSDQVYKCQKVVARRRHIFDGVDYAIVQLDRKVTDRTPVQMDFVSDPELGTPVTLMGFPSGLPLKVADSSTILKNSSPYFFESDVDAFRGNSGSPIFDSITGKVIGILSSGQNDYVSTGSCKVPKVCKSEDNCLLSVCSRVKNLKDDFEKLMATTAAATNNN